MTWWCTRLHVPWSWQWRPYPGIWLLVAGAVVTYLSAARADPATTRRHRTSFLAGMGVLWVATDWPVGTLGAGYLASVHMLEYVLYTLVAAPLLLVGVSEAVARRVLTRLRLTRPARVLARPVIAGAVFNIALVATHSPIVVDTFRANQFGSFAIDMAWLGSGLVLWLPICAPLPELRAASYPAKMVYLFLAAGVVAIVPASFLTFAPFPPLRRPTSSPPGPSMGSTPPPTSSWPGS